MILFFYCYYVAYVSEYTYIENQCVRKRLDEIQVILTLF